MMIDLEEVNAWMGEAMVNLHWLFCMAILGSLELDYRLILLLTVALSLVLTNYLRMKAHREKKNNS